MPPSAICSMIGVEDGLRAVAEDHRSVADAPVDVVVAVDVEEVSSLAASHHDGARAGEARVARLASGDDFLAFLEHLTRLSEMTVVDQIVSHGGHDSFLDSRATRRRPRGRYGVPGE